jgi:Concanavalin A-like lectin/glucanases superfamily
MHAAADIARSFSDPRPSTHPIWRGLFGIWGGERNLRPGGFSGGYITYPTGSSTPARNISKQLGHCLTFDYTNTQVARTGKVSSWDKEKPITMISHCYFTGALAEYGYTVSNNMSDGGSYGRGIGLWAYNAGGSYVVNNVILYSSAGYVWLALPSTAVYECRNKWVVIAFTYTGEQNATTAFKLYHNGFVGSHSTFSSAGSPFGATALSSRQMYIGGRPWTDHDAGSYLNTVPWRGDIGRVAVFHRVLSPAEIHNLSWAMMAYPLGLPKLSMVGKAGAGSSAKPWLYRRASAVSRPYLQVA